MSIQIGGFPEVFDSSIMNEYKECPQKFNLGTSNLWKSRGRSIHLHAGGAFAHGIEAARRAFYEGKVTHAKPKDWDDSKAIFYGTELTEPFNAENSVAIGLGALLEFYGDFAYPEDAAKTPERMAGALEFYFANYPLLRDEGEPITLPGGKLGIEFGFVEPLEVCHPVTGNPILYSGRMDAILNYAGSRLLTDEKTASSLGATWGRQWDLRAQFTGYAWGCKKNNIHVDGALIRGVSILKTKYETQQAVSYRPQWQIDRWFMETNEWIEEAITQWKRKYFRHNLGDACASYGGCQFKAVCQADNTAPNHMAEQILKTYFERRHWDPVARKETLVVEVEGTDAPAGDTGSPNSDSLSPATV